MPQLANITINSKHKSKQTIQKKSTYAAMVAKNLVSQSTHRCDNPDLVPSSQPVNYCQLNDKSADSPSFDSCRYNYAMRKSNPSLAGVTRATSNKVPRTRRHTSMISGSQRQSHDADASKHMRKSNLSLAGMARATSNKVPRTRCHTSMISGNEQHSVNTSNRKDANASRFLRKSNPSLAGVARATSNEVPRTRRHTSMISGSQSQSRDANASRPLEESKPSLASVARATSNEVPRTRCHNSMISGSQNKINPDENGDSNLNRLYTSIKKDIDMFRATYRNGESPLTHQDDIIAMSQKERLKDELNQINLSGTPYITTTPTDDIDISKEIARTITSTINTMDIQECNTNRKIPQVTRDRVIAHAVRIATDSIAADIKRCEQLSDDLIPDLMYLNVQLGESDDPQETITVQGLMDTGCSNSILDWHTFLQIPEFCKIKQEALRKETTIMTAAGTQTQVMGRATIKLWIWDSVAKIHVPFHHQFLIAAGLRELMYLGRDFIYPPVGTSSSSNLLGVDFFRIDREGLEFDASLSKKEQLRRPIELSTTAKVKIPAQSMAKVAVSLSRERRPDKTYLVQNTVLNTRKHFEVMETNDLMEDDGIQSVALINSTNKAVLLRPNQVVAQLEHIEDIPGIENPLMNVYLTADGKQYFQPCREHDIQKKTYKLNHITPTDTEQETREHDIYQFHRALDKKDDLIMTPDERDDLTDKLLIDGKAQLPISASNFNLKKLANFEVDDEGIPKSKAELLNQIDMKHIPRRYRPNILNVFDKHAEVLETHTFNCPPTPLVEALIDIDQTKIKKDDCWKCKKHDIPLQYQEAYGTIIDIMAGNDIIEYSQEGSGPAIISNPILVKKKTFKKGQPIKATHLRLCVDLRLVNSIMKHKVVTLPPIRSLLHKFNDAVWMTSLDISNMFFAIPVHKDSRNLLQFYDHRGQIVRLKRLPQGGRTSSWYANELMQKALGHLPNIHMYCDDIYIVCKKREGFTQADYYAQHMKDIEEVLIALNKAKLKIKPLKIELCKTQMEILGYQWKLGKFSLPEAKVSAINNLKRPDTQTQLKSYLSTLSFYRNNLPRLSQVEAVMQRMTRGTHNKTDKLHWMPDAIEAYENSKALTKNAYDTEPPVLGEKFYCCSDASGLAASGVLWQFIDGKVRFIGCSGRQFNKHEENLSIYEKELLALSNLISTYSPVLDGAPQITCYIDSRSLIFLALAKNSSSKLVRMANQLTNYPLKIVHIRSKVNALADAYSRLMTLEEKETYPYIDKSFAQQFCDDLSELHPGFPISDELLSAFLTKQSPKNPLKRLNPSSSTKKVVDADNLGPLKQGTKLQKRPPRYVKTRMRNQDLTIHQSPRMDDFQDFHQVNAMQAQPSPYYMLGAAAAQKINEQEESLDEYDYFDHKTNTIEELVFLKTALRNGKITFDEFKKAQDTDPEIQQLLLQPNRPKHFQLRQGILFYVPDQNDPDNAKLYLPKILVQHLLTHYHMSFMGMHRSRQQLYKAITQLYYRKNLREIVNQYADQCYLCKTEKKTRGERKPLIGRKTLPSVPREHYAFDIYEVPLTQGFRYIYVWVDLATNFVILVPARTRKAIEIKKSLERNIIAIFGIPTSIYSDNEKAIESYIVRNACTNLGIHYSHTAPYSPQSNSNAEGAVALSKDLFRIYIRQTGKSWRDLLHLVNASLNTRFLSPTDLTPEKLLFGRVNQSGELIRCNDLPQDTKSLEYSQALSRKVDELQEKYDRNRRRNAARTLENANQRRKDLHLKPNDLVWLYDNEIKEGRGSTLDPKYSGPYQIWETHSNGQTCLLKDIATGKLRAGHIQHLKRMDYAPSNIIVPMDIDNRLKTMRTQNSTKNLISSSRKEVGIAHGRQQRRLHSSVRRMHTGEYTGPRTRSRAKY